MIRSLGKFRWASTRSISWPTIPVAPTTATFNRLEVGTPSVYFDQRTVSGRSAQTEQVVQAAIEPLSRRDRPDGKQDTRHVRLAARRAVRDGQRLARQPEYHLLVGHQPGQPHAVHRD